MIGTTSFLVSVVLLLFNPLNGGEIMCFPKLYNLSDWLWWLWCLVLNFPCGLLSKILYFWWSLIITTRFPGRVGCNLPASQFAYCNVYNLTGTVTTSFIGRNTAFYRILLIWGWYLFCLDFNFHGFGVLFPVKK